MLAATRRASRSARCTSRPMNSGASSSRNNASTPEVRPLPWRSGQARMRYGIATCPACVAIRLMTSGSRRVCVIASSCFCVRVRMRRVGVLRPGECQALVGHDDAGEHALEVPGGVGQQRLQVVGAAGLRMAAGHRQQQLQVLVARGQVFVEFLDVGARQQVAAQQLQRGPQVIVHVGEWQHVRVPASALHTTATTAASDAAIVTQPE